ncbi:hypothetical protein RRG08_002166 [Elysia crispata]|uniref:Uncharacterized protein n=1 Tax=Elysia crispata TaxID=231223 RepID=A0AAE0ZAW0_9GAST|nr:hypothetical protein RRG08_002166 [Elysia crispata]
MIPDPVTGMEEKCRGRKCDWGGALKLNIHLGIGDKGLYVFRNLQPIASKLACSEYGEFLYEVYCAPSMGFIIGKAKRRSLLSASRLGFHRLLA